ncbi:MAG: hypothetical protein ACI4IR_08200 [Eubacterium sp.]
MLKNSIINHELTETICERNDKTVPIFEKIFYKPDMPKSILDIDLFIDELSWFNGKEMYCRIYQLEVLTDALFNIIIAGNLFTVEEAENLWEISKNNNQDDDFETLHGEIKRIISKRRAENGNQ